MWDKKYQGKSHTKPPRGVRWTPRQYGVSSYAYGSTQDTESLMKLSQSGPGRR